MEARRTDYTSEKSARLEARLSHKLKETLQRAADLSGRSLTEFVLNASQDHANKVIREHEVITLTAKESKRFIDVLLSPPEPNEALKKAMKRHEELFRDDGLGD